MADSIDPRVVIGHVHLKVADLERALAFYSGVLGFEVTTRTGDAAAFLSAGGYHHHLGVNTWAGAGALPPTSDDARLAEWTIELPEAASLVAAAASLAAAGVPVEQDGADLVTRDPWSTQVRMRVIGSDEGRR